MRYPSYIDDLYECTECRFSYRCSKKNGCMQECLDYSWCVKDEEEISYLINSIIEKYPEEIYCKWSLYTIVSYTFSIKDKLTSTTFFNSLYTF